MECPDLPEGGGVVPQRLRSETMMGDPPSGSPFRDGALLFFYNADVSFLLLLPPLPDPGSKT